MNLVYKTGNLLDVTRGHIVHGCNAQGAMGSGVALQLRNRYPAVFDEYRQIYYESGLHLGEAHPVLVSEQCIVWNAITQARYGKLDNGVRYASYDAIADAFARIDRAVTDNHIIDRHIHIPMIGAGLAGGNWDVIGTIIQSVVTNPVTVWVYNKEST